MLIHIGLDIMERSCDKDGIRFLVLIPPNHINSQHERMQNFRVEKLAVKDRNNHNASRATHLVQLITMLEGQHPTNI